MSIALVHPCPTGKRTDAFGWRAAIPGVVGPQLHTGQDWAAPAGTPVYAAHAGRVNKVWWDTMRDGSPAGGNMLQIGAANLSTRYAHLSSYAVRLGDEVRAGQVIGYVGRTGAATGDHLHFELLLPGGQFVNPVPYLTATPQKGPAMPYRLLNLKETLDGGRSTTDKVYFDAGPGAGIKHVQHPDHVKLLRRFITDKPGDCMYPAEIAIVNGYLR
ncbi:M23 family metallopeptidase [Leucobacter ruminantium]|uniref:M23 family metallopeptidase n=1 Tax=Leucobacter ruminantium TaxID=1289170 RepID=A0A939LW73_9MICO|nr:M23 family metallopeptidase [Leucobacter ruminantium]MBO1805894.1 M23 family metallopeptidase [Leucobacter ruminantium]